MRGLKRKEKWRMDIYRENYVHIHINAHNSAPFINPLIAFRGRSR